MALLGSSVDPRLFVQDYSGFTRAADIQGQSMANIGADIGGIAKQFGEYKKQQSEQEKRVKSAELVANAIAKSFPTLAPVAMEAQMIMGDKNNSLQDRVAAADAVEKALNIGISNAYKEREFGLQKRQLDIEEGQGIQSALIKRAELEAEARKPGPITDVNVPGGVMQMVRNPRTGVLEPIQVSGQTPADGITSALGDGPPMDIPTVEGPVIPANEGVVSQDGTTVSYLGKQYTVDPGVLPALPTNKQAAGIDGAISLAPTTATPVVNDDVGFKPTKTEKPETRMTAEQVQNLAAQGFKVSATPLADGSFMVSGTDIGGQAGETIEMIPGGGMRIVRGGGGDKAEAAKEARKEQSFERSRAIIGSASKIIPQIQSALSANPLIARGQQTLGQVLPAGEAGRIASDLETIRVQTSKEEIGKMRASSPTGSAGGTITEKEWPKFENRFGKMEVGMNPNDLVSNVQKTALNQFESVNGTPEEVVKLFNDGKISKPVFDDYLKEYKQTRSILGISDTGTGGPGDDWTKYNPNLLRFDKEKQNQLSPEAQSLQDRLNALKANQ
jgi:hypothetical protein